MYYESGIFPLFAAETKASAPTTTSDGPVGNGGELPPPPDDPPKA